MKASVGGTGRTWSGIMGAVGLVLAGGASARAEEILHNGVPDLLSGEEMSGWIVADDFTVAAQAGFDGYVLDGLTFWTLENASAGGFTGSFEWRIHVSGADDPGPVVAAGTSTAPTRTSFGLVPDTDLEEFENSLSISTGLLAFDTRYWLSLHNGPSTGPSAVTTDQGVYWETTNAFEGTARLNAPPVDGLWFPVYETGSVDLAFALNGDLVIVPEPSMVATFWLGIGVLAALRRRRV